MQVVFRDSRRNVLLRSEKQNPWVPPVGTEIPVNDALVIVRRLRYDPVKDRATLYCVTPAELRQEASEIDRT